MPSHNIEIAADGERVSFTKTASAEANLEESISADQTDTEYAIAIDVSALKSLYIHCDTAITIETNSGSVPDDTLTIVANRPVVWEDDSPLTNPLGTDVTSIFVTETASAAGTLTIKTLQDASP